MRWSYPVPEGPLKAAKATARAFLSQTLAWTSPASRPEIKALLHSLSVHRTFLPSDLPDPQLAEAETVGKWNDYLVDLAEFPKWVLIRACEAARREAGKQKHEFFPLPGHLRKLCQEIYDPLQREIALARRVTEYENPQAAQQTPEQRDAEKRLVQRTFERTMAKMARGMPLPQPPKEPEQ